MYLTRIELDRNKTQTQIALRNPNIFHGAIEKTFGDNTERKLWRVDTLRGRRYLMIVSRTLPDFSSMLWQFAPNGAVSQSKSYDKFLDSIEPDSVWEFRLCAAPVIKKTPQDKEKKRGIPRALKTEEEQLDWLERQGIRYGFEAFRESVMIENPGPVYMKKGSGEERQEFYMLKVTFNGKLKVKDPELFKGAMMNGIGRERAFGGGMLTIAPIQI